MTRAQLCLADKTTFGYDLEPDNTYIDWIYNQTPFGLISSQIIFWFDLQPNNICI